jgi:hypothetical protein
VVFEHPAPHKLRCSLTVTKPAIPYCRYTQTLAARLKTLQMKEFFSNIDLNDLWLNVLDKFENVPDYIRYVLIAVVILYEPILTTISCTLGQLLMDIRVRKFKDPEKKVLFHEAIIRLLPKLILGWISFLLIIFSVNKRAIHDYVSGTIVIIPKRKIEKPAVNPSL